MPPEGALFVSPHLDDAVLACGALIAASTRPVVLTLFAGRAPTGQPLTDWDRAAGFVEGEDVVAARREEDREALALLGAIPAWLDLRDDQYGGAGTPADIAPILATAVAARAPAALFLPLGLFHSDHLRASDAGLQVATDSAMGATRQAVHLYEEPMYRLVDRVRDERLEALRARGLRLARRAFDVAADARARKREAIACYRSQLRALGTRNGHADALAPERYWTLQ